tara:strand:+ start:2884 stop:3321 length:438 start_codon:yes stop_codon:yes gene_type:complete
MKITESQLRRIVRQTIIEESKIKKLNEGIMQDISMLPGTILMTVIATFSACNGTPVKEAHLTDPENAVKEIVKAPKEDFSPFIKKQKEIIRNLRSEGRGKEADQLESLIDGLEAAHKFNKNLSGIDDSGNKVQVGLGSPITSDIR